MAVVVRAVTLLRLLASTMNERSHTLRSGNGLRVQLLQLLANRQVGEVRLPREVVRETPIPHSANADPLVDIVDREHASAHVADTVLLRLRGRLRTDR